MAGRPRVGPGPAPAAAFAKIVPERHLFDLTTSARRYLTAAQVSGSVVIVLQAAPANAGDVDLDFLEAMDKPFVLEPADVLGLEVPTVFPPGRPYGFEFALWLKADTAGDDVLAWLFKAPG